MSEPKIGRPKADIDWERVDDLLISGCSGTEIAAFFGINPHTLYDRCFSDNGIMFSDYSHEKHSKGDSLLRDMQFKKALGIHKEGDNTMLVWLGKNRLKQRDTPEDAAQKDSMTPQQILELKKIINAC